MWDAIEKGKYMADIISGKSRFNGDRNAPVKKVISINREMAASTEDNEDVLDEAAVKRKIRRYCCYYYNCSYSGCSLHSIKSNR